MKTMELIESKIENLIEKAENGVGPDYVTPKAAADIAKSGIETPEQNPVEAPDLTPSNEPGHIAGILNKIGQAATETGAAD